MAYFHRISLILGLIAVQADATESAPCRDARLRGHPCSTNVGEEEEPQPQEKPDQDERRIVKEPKVQPASQPAPPAPRNTLEDAQNFGSKPSAARRWIGPAPKITYQPPAILSVQDQAQALIKAGKTLPPAMTGQISKLDFEHQPFTNLTPLAGLSALRTLRLNYTQVADLSPLSQLYGLQALYINATKVIDLAPLAKLRGLYSLYLVDTPVESLAPVSDLSDLTVYVRDEAKAASLRATLKWGSTVNVAVPQAIW